jgi:hypothetical protein
MSTTILFEEKSENLKQISENIFFSSSIYFSTQSQENNKTFCAKVYFGSTILFFVTWTKFGVIRPVLFYVVILKVKILFFFLKGFMIHPGARSSLQVISCKVWHLIGA